MANMDLMALLSTVVLVATISTSIFALAAYAASRGYVRKRIASAGKRAGLRTPAKPRARRMPAILQEVGEQIEPGEKTNGTQGVPA